MSEQWLPIKGIISQTGLTYEVSSEGRVRSSTGLIRKLQVVAGYLQVNLKNGLDSPSFRVHRLVAEAFIVNPNNYTTIDHRNGDKFNNRMGNLRWLPPKRNLQKARNKAVIVKDNDTALGVFESADRAAKVLDIPAESIRSVCRGESSTAYGYIFTYIDLSEF